MRVSLFFMEESGFRFLLLVSTYFVSAGWSNWYEHFEAISSGFGREFFIKSLNLRVLQGACLKQMATSQLTGKVASQVKSSDLASKPLVKCREMRTVSALERKAKEGAQSSNSTGRAGKGLSRCNERIFFL